MNQIVRAPLHGEIIGPRDTVQVIGSPHPLQNNRVETFVPAGLTVREILERATPPSRVKRRFIVYVAEEPVPEEMWDRVRVKAGVTVVYRAVPRGGQGGGILRSILMLVVAVAAFVFAGPIAGAIFGAATSLTTSLVAAAITIGGTLLINALFPIRPPKLEKDEREQSYSISGAKNQANPWGTIPLILGRHRMSPLYGARPYTEIVGDDQYLRMLFVWGIGPMDIEDIRIGNTLLSAFKDVQIETRRGYPNDKPITLYPKEVLEETLSVELKFGETHSRMTSDDVDEISIDLTAPNGVVAISRKHGNKDQWSVVAQVRYKKAFGQWSTPELITLDGNKQDVIRKGWYKKVPRGKYQVEVKRNSPIFQDTDAYEIVDDIYWTAIRGIRNEHPVATKMPIAMTAIRIKATDQLNGTIDTLNGIITSRQLSYDGTTWVSNATSSNPADLFRWVLQCPSNKRPVSDAKIDLDTLQRWWWYCKNKSFEFDMVRERQESVYSTLADIAAAGRATPIFKDGKWSVVWDEENPPVIQHFTPRNSRGFTGTRKYRQMPHGFRVRFINRGMNWKEDERLVFDDGYDESNATIYESIEFPGVTTAGDVWRHARFHIAQARLRPETYELTTDFEHIVCTRGDRVRVTHDVPLFGIGAGRVRSVSGQTVVFDDVVIMESAKAYTVRFRLQDGSAVTAGIISGAGETSTVVLDTDLSGRVQRGDLYMFGELNRESVIMRVLSIQPGENMSATLTLVDDAPEISQADQGAIPPFYSQITLPPDPLELAPTSLQVREFLYNEGDSLRGGARISWQVSRMGAAASFEVQIRNEASVAPEFKRVAVVTAPQTAAQVLDLSPGMYSFRVRALFADGGWSDWTAVYNLAIYGTAVPPEDVGGFRIATLGDISLLTWDAVDPTNLSFYEVRFSPLTTGVTWGQASVINGSVVGNQLQVPTRVGTYLIKAISRQGVPSANPAILTTEIAALSNVNVVAQIDEDPGWAGTFDGTDIVTGWLQLGSSSPIQDWATLDEVQSMYLGAGSLEGAGAYYFAGSLDLGAVYTSRVTTTVDAFGLALADTMDTWQTLAAVESLSSADPSAWEVRVQYRITNADPALGLWTDWEDIVASDITARAFEFRALLEGDADAMITPAVRSLSVTVDMPDRVEGDNDVLVPVGGLRINYAQPFRAKPSIALAIQDRASGDREAISGQDETGFFLEFFDQAGNSVARTTDWISKGYGKRVSA